ncbi:hypothetical protein F4819DRAFT_488471 [Hypoxylon fuscum]|nr:hypothetical protein F4819DRAFT_488471 [Hypoxylon fuscum]
MAPLHHALVGLSLATSVMGAAVLPYRRSTTAGLDDAPNMPPTVMCSSGNMLCNQNFVYICKDRKWVAWENCFTPSYCNSDSIGNAWCAEDTSELKKRAEAGVPTPAVTSAPNPAANGPPGWCTGGQTRCNGQDLQVCNDNGVWEPFEHCFECMTNDDGFADCIPFTTTTSAPTPTPTKVGDFRCNGNWKEIFDRGQWHQVERCAQCTTDPDGTIDCAPTSTDPAVAPTATPECTKGKLRCNGNDMELCDGEFGKWDPVDQCSQCSQEGDTVVCEHWTTTSPTPTQTTPAMQTSQIASNTKTTSKTTTSKTYTTSQKPARQTSSTTSKTTSKATSQISSQTTSQTTSKTTSNTTSGKTKTSQTTSKTTSKTTSPTTSKTTITSKTTSQQPAKRSSASLFNPREDNPCFAGEVRCVGSDRIEACSVERNWEDYGPCPNCKQLYNTAINCTFEEANQYGDEAVWTVGTVPALHQERPYQACATGFKRCAQDTTTVQICEEGRFVDMEACPAKETCVGIHEGIAFCLSQEVADRYGQSYVEV